MNRLLMGSGNPEVKAVFQILAVEPCGFAELIQPCPPRPKLTTGESHPLKVVFEYHLQVLRK